MYKCVGEWVVGSICMQQKVVSTDCLVTEMNGTMNLKGPITMTQRDKRGREISLAYDVSWMFYNIISILIKCRKMELTAMIRLLFNFSDVILYVIFFRKRGVSSVPSSTVTNIPILNP